MRATVATPNITSARVLEKAGFIRGNLVADEIDTHEFILAIPKESISAAQQSAGGDGKPAPQPCRGWWLMLRSSTLTKENIHFQIREMTIDYSEIIQIWQTSPYFRREEDSKDK
jgi:hypothetical protein